MIHSRKIAVSMLWLARTWGTLVLVVILFLLGEDLLGNGPAFAGAREALIFAFFPVGTAVGLGIAWKAPGAGGLVATMAILGLFVLRPDQIENSLLVAGIAPPGLVYLGYWLLSIATESNVSFAGRVERVAVEMDIDERLAPVFVRAFEQGLAEALESNGIDASVSTVSPLPDGPTERAHEVSAPDASMRIEIDPLYRAREDGYEAVVGTTFDVVLIDAASGERIWHGSGKVDYVTMFGPHYVASDNMRKEFAWTTVAAIVEAFVADVNGDEAAPIYRSIEGRRRHGQLTD
jgi:hypothetical protein